MDRPFLTVVIGAALVAAVAVAVTVTQWREPAFVAGDQPVTAEQVLRSLQTHGYSDVQVARQGNFFQGTGSKNGKTAKVVVDARTGRLVEKNEEAEQ